MRLANAAARAGRPSSCRSTCRRGSSRSRTSSRRVADILAETGLAPGALELEITESVLMDQSEAGIRTLRRLADSGVRLVLDDFGTGYSSLAT